MNYTYIKASSNSACGVKYRRNCNKSTDYMSKIVGALLGPTRNRCQKSYNKIQYLSQYHFYIMVNHLSAHPLLNAPYNFGKRRLP